VIYEEEYVDSQMVGIGKILGAYFKHRNKEFFAIPFMQDSIYQFFDENGQSLRKEFLRTPIEFARISSRYSSSRLHPVLKIRRPHRGVDYAAPTGTPIRTVGDGQVIEAAYTRSNGNYIKIRHNSVYTTMYLHMSRFGKGIKRGVQVKQGQVIGFVGKTGLATGSHLHFSFFMNGSYVNPLTIEVPPSHPVKETLNGEFEKQKIIVLDELMEIDKTIVSENDPPV
jgi:murein DD-endopeptidase MepM/ murein hydrolase activator NlpD